MVCRRLATQESQGTLTDSAAKAGAGRPEVGRKHRGEVELSRTDETLPMFRDPLLCPQCGAEMWLWYVWHPEYGVIYDELAQFRAGQYDLPLEIKLSEDKDQSLPIVQLPLFAWPISFVYV